ncbi:MAG: ribosomal protein S18-alanine N-acetyltransferase [Gemmatimonadaceae bacterium]|nr:ribosomal protein S18-alanine N-acetyltransferase [Gemmatimonadaceae bacterium]
MSAALRQAAAADVAAVAAIEREVFSDPWSEAEFTAVLDLPHAIFLVGLDGLAYVAGYAVVSCVLDESEILNLAVSPGSRRNGLGARLLDAAMATARGRGARTFFLEVRESNLAARALYESRGFAELSRRQRYYRNPAEDALLLRLEEER